MSRSTHCRFPLYRAILFALASCVLFAPRADAALVLSVGSITIQKPIAGAFSFSLAVTAQAFGAEQITDYSLPFDIDPAGTGLPVGLVLNGATQSAGGGTFTQFPEANDDLIVIGSGLSIDIADGASVELFDLNFTATDLLALGEYTVDLNEFSGSYSVNTFETPTANDGLIRVTAVPEPASMSAMALVAIGAIGVAHRRRTRKPIEDKAT